MLKRCYPLVVLLGFLCFYGAYGQGTEEGEFSLVEDLAAFLQSRAPGVDPQLADFNGSNARESTWRRASRFAGNGIPDAAEFALLQHVLNTPSVELGRQGGTSHTLARKIFAANLTSATEHLPLIDGASQRAVAAYSTINFGSELNFVGVLLGTPWPGYKNKANVKTLGAFFHQKNSADGDDRTNLGEWQSSGGDMDAFVRLALDGEGRSTLWDEIDASPLYEQPKSMRRIVRVVLGAKVLNPELEALAADCKIAMRVSGARVPVEEAGWPVAVGSPIELASYTESARPLAFKCWKLADMCYPELFTCVNNVLAGEDVLEERIPLVATYYWDVVRDPEYSGAFECIETSTGERIKVRATLPPMVWRALNIMGFEFVGRAPEPGALEISAETPWVLWRTFRGFEGGESEAMLPMPEHLWSNHHE